MKIVKCPHAVTITLPAQIKTYVNASGPPNGGSMYISVVSNLLTSSRISSTLQVKIKKYVKKSGPSKGGSVVHPDGSHWMLNYFHVNATLIL